MTEEKVIIIAVNKWDAIEKDDKTIYRHTEKIREILSFMPYAEILFISAKSGQRLNKIFENDRCCHREQQYACCNRCIE